MKTYPIHPAAAKLPLLTGEARDDLKKALHDRGQLEPIKLHNVKGKPHVLDGRNRQELLRELGIAPKYVTADLRGRTPEQYVVDMNLERRHLTPSQKGAYALKLMPELKKAAKERQVEAGKKKKKPAGASSAAKAAAKTMKVSTRTIERAIAIAKKAPELLPEIEKGKLTLKAAAKKVKRAEQDKKVAAYSPPEGAFQMHTLDFSWPYDDTREGNDNQRGLDYPPQTLEQIVAYIRGPLARGLDPAGVVVGNWITGPISIDSSIAPIVQREFEALGLKMIHERIWKKTRATGGQYVGQGTGIRWDAEKLQIYVRGDVAMAETGEAHGTPIQQTVFEAHVGKHSEKPQRAYDDLEALFPRLTKRLEHYSRAPRKGWVTTGAEMPDAASAPVGSAQTSSAAQVDGALVRSPPADQGTPPDKGGALSKGKKGKGRRATPPLASQFPKTKAKPAGPARWICPECNAEDETGEAGFNAHMATHAPKPVETAPDVTPPDRPKALDDNPALAVARLDPKIFEQPAPVGQTKLYEYGSAAAPAGPKLPLDGLVDGTIELSGNFEAKPPELAPAPEQGLASGVGEDSWEYAHAEGGKLAAEAAEKKPAEGEPGYVPPVDPASLKPVDPDGIDF